MLRSQDSQYRTSDISKHILLWIGKLEVDMFNSWTWEDAGDEVKATKICAKFEKDLTPKVNCTVTRFHLQFFIQCPDKSIDNFIARSQSGS